MCGRFFRRDITWDAYREVVDLRPPPNVDAPEATFNAAPMSVQPVLRLSYDGSYVKMAPCYWGLVPSWWTKPIQEKSFQTFNTPAETAAEKPVYRGAFRHKRCLVPVSGFYQWTGPKGGRIPFAVALRDRHWFCLAGLWDAALIDGSEIQTFTVLTTTPNDLMSGLHTRMPVIVRPEDYQRWLSPAPGKVGDIFQPYPTDDMQAWPVSDRVGNVRNNSPDLLLDV